MFERLEWKNDRMLFDDLVFRLEQSSEDSDWELGDDCFRLYKGKPLISQYQKFFERNGNVQGKNILELGIWDGGSTVFWNEFFKPNKLVAIDLTKRGDSQYFTKYLKSRHLEEQVKTFWGIDQKDTTKLLNIVSSNFDGPLDIIIDDASHRYLETKASFEALFPLLRDGGLYIIEDWAWAHWPGFSKHFAGVIEPTKLVFELVELIGSNGASGNLSVFQGFAVMTKGNMQTPSKNFDIEKHIVRRPKD